MSSVLDEGDYRAKSRKYQGVLEVKSRVKTWQVRGIWSQQLEHKQVPQWGTEPGVRKGIGQFNTQTAEDCFYEGPIENRPHQFDYSTVSAEF